MQHILLGHKFVRVILIVCYFLSNQIAAVIITKLAVQKRPRKLPDPKYSLVTGNVKVSVNILL
jgi:hypothetical protein